MPGKIDDLVFITNTDDIRTMYAKDGPTPKMASLKLLEQVRKGPLLDLYRSPGLSASGVEWLDFRQRIQQDMMRPKSALFYMEDLSEIMDEVIAKLLSSVDENQEVCNMRRTFMQFGLEAICKMFIGSNLGVIQENEDGKKLIDTTTRFFVLFSILITVPPSILTFTPQYKEFVECQRVLYNICKKHMDLALEKDRIDGSLEGTVLERLLKRNGRDSNVPIVMAVDSMVAGVDTTGNAASILLYDLASNPDKQEKLHQEIVKVTGKTGQMTEASLTELRYLKACIAESLRLNPIVHITSRTSQEDMVLGGYKIPKGSFVVRNNAVTTRDTSYFDNPDKFLPERWIRESKEHVKVDAFANLPFGFGPRACPGQRFARLELQMVAFKIIQKFRLEYHQEPIAIQYIGIGKPNRDFNLKFVQR